MWLYLHLWTIKLALGRSLWQPLISELALSDFKVVSATDDATYLQLNTKSQELQMLSTCCRFCDSHNFPCYEPLQSVNKYASSLNCILFAVLMPQNGILQQLKINLHSEQGGGLLEVLPPMSEKTPWKWIIELEPMKKQENNNPNAQCMNCPGVELYVRGSVKIGKMRKYFCNFAV